MDYIVYVLDLIIIEFCLNVFWWVWFCKYKVVVKFYILLDVKCEIFCFIYILDGKYYDVNVLNIFEFEFDVFYVMD